MPEKTQTPPSLLEEEKQLQHTSESDLSEDTPGVGAVPRTQRGTREYTLPVWMNWKIFATAFGILIFAGTLFASYKLGQKQTLLEFSQTQLLPTSTLTPTLTPGATADWETYTNIKWKYQISYPSFWRLNGEPDIDQISLGSQEKRADGSAKFLMDLTVWGRTPGVSNLKEEARFKGEEFGNCPSDPSPFMGICAPSQPKQIVEKSTDSLPFLYYVVKASGKRIVIIPLPGDETRFITIDSILWPKESSWEIFDLVLSTFRFLNSTDFGEGQVGEIDCQLLEKLEMKDLVQISEADCQKCGGKWELLSMDLNMTGCNPKTSDEGRSCTDEDQCLGVCLAQDASSISGVCSSYKFTLGCGFEFDEGRVVEICRD